jgi:photosystem II stability/assembly factor-like uncharacterized protein
MRLTRAFAATISLFLVVADAPARAAGWAVGANGVVLKSIDAGANWTATSPAGVTLTAASFVNDNDGWVAGAGGLLMHTINGGSSWLQSSPTVVNLNDVMFVDASRGWAVGNSGTVLRTTNGGTNWITSTPTPSALNAVYFINANTGWAVGNGVALRTTNGGVNWTVSAPTAAILEDVFFINATTGWAVGSGGTVLKTTNGGASWTATKPTTRPLNAVTFVSASVGWAVGGSGTVLKSANGGNNWTEQRPVSTELTSVAFIDGTTGWAAGEAGAVIKTADAGDTWIATHPTSLALNDVTFKSIPTGISVAVQTNPPGRSFSVDDVEYTSTQIFEWNPDEFHAIATSSPQAGASGTQYVWLNWSSGGGISQTVAPTTSRTYTANFTTQHFLTTTAGANGTVDPVSGWHDAGTPVEITATPDAGYGFNGWTASGSGSYSGNANPATITMDGPITESAAFGNSVTVTVRSTPNGRSFTVDGTPYSSSQTFTWAPGAPHTIEATSPQDVSADTRYLFTTWSDGEAATHTVSPNGNITYTATFKVQYVLTMTAGAGGTAGPSGGWTDGGSLVSVTASPDSGYSFDSWSGTGSGSYTGASNPATVTMNGPVTQQANFRVGTSPPTPSTLTLLSSVPNPFTDETEIRFGLPRAADVTIDVFDVAGRRVMSDVMHSVPAGWGSYQLDATTGAGGRLNGGVYFVRITATGTAQTGKLIVLR